MYSRTSRVPSGTWRLVCGSTRLPRASQTMSQSAGLAAGGAVVGQDRLAEVAVVQLLACPPLDVAAGGVHDLARLHRQRAAARRLQVGFLHDRDQAASSTVILRRRREGAAPAGPRAGLADLAPVLVGPLLRHLLHVVEEAVREVVHCRPPSQSATADLPRSVNDRRAPVRCRTKAIGASSPAYCRPSSPPRPSTPSSRKAPASERAVLLFRPTSRSLLGQRVLVEGEGRLGDPRVARVVVHPLAVGEALAAELGERQAGQEVLLADDAQRRGLHRSASRPASP